MNIVKKTMMSVLFGLSMFGLTTSMSAYALNADAEAACPGCHGVIIGTTQAVGSGGRKCAQRSLTEWMSTISRMKGKGCVVVAGTEQGMATYLACVENPTCTSSGQTVICYRADGSSFTHTVMPTDMNVCPPGSSFNPPPPCPDGVLTLSGPMWTCTTTSSTSSTSTTSTTTTTMALTCYKPTADGLSYITETSYIGYCSAGWAYTPPPPCPDGILSIVSNHIWQCSVATSSTSTTSTTSTSSTTTTTLCNTYVNGTTQYPYSGSGSCHSFANDDVTGLHIVRDQSYCKKHMSHLNIKGNHVHAYPHPACM